MLWGAVIGAVVGAVIEGVAQKMRGEELDWGKIGKAALVGAVTGLVGGFVAGALLKAGGAATATGVRSVATKVVASSAGGATAGATDRLIHNGLEERPLFDGVLRSAALGAGVGAVTVPLAGPVQRLTDKALGALRNARSPTPTTLTRPTTTTPTSTTPITPTTPPRPTRGAVQALEDAPVESGLDDVVRPGPVSVRVAPLADDSVVVDSNIAIALRKRHELGEASLQAGERRMLERLERLGTGDVRLADRSVEEAAKKAQRGFTTSSFPLTTTRDSAEYLALQQKLLDANVGAAKGAADREIVADLFFAKVEPGTVPRFVCFDGDVYKKLAKLGGIDPAKLGRPIADAYPDGFRVTLDGRSIDVIAVR